MRFYDLSRRIGDIDKGFLKETIKYTNHKVGGDQLGMSLIVSKDKSILKTIIDLFKYILRIRRVDSSDFKDSIGLAKESVKLNTHSGTHLDAPYHFGTESEGKRAKTIDEVPMEWCYGKGVMLDLSHTIKDGDKNIPKEYIEDALREINVSDLNKVIVLIKTRHKNMKRKDVGMSREATKYLVENGVKIIGIDTPGFDSPFEDMLEEYLETKNNDYLWPAHLYGREKEYCHIENLYLDDFYLKKDFNISCFPIKVKKSSAAWVRVVAMQDYDL